MSADPAQMTRIASPPHQKRRLLRVRGTDVTLLEEVRKMAVADLGVDIQHESLDFLTCQC
ncbi:hypothetical protein [Sulfitobacter sp. HI0054]|uniref:hypothetical protein n=1 Tax=Sulfitobacter sp. HI0054 TaxID=1822238 RepID=UPI0018D2BAF0|nr:hypothetical protein [Sulfitobacter sp. HI0054]